MTGETITPGDLTARLDVSDRTVRRLAEAYSEVYGNLPKNRRGHRLFPVLAVERITAAHQTMRDIPGMSAVDAFRAQRDGVTIPRRGERSPSADSLAPVMAELSALRAELAAVSLLLQAVMAGQSGTSENLRQRAAQLPQNDADLLERLKAGHRIREVSGKLLELSPAGKQQAVSADTVSALIKRGMVERDGDEYRLTAARLL